MAGCHEVVWPVGSSSLGNAPVEAFGPGPGITGIAWGPPIVPEVEGLSTALAAGEPADGGSAGGAVGVAAARGISGIGLRDGAGAVAEGVGDSSGACVGWGCMPACGVAGR